MTTHVVACIWLIVGTMSEGEESESWIKEKFGLDETDEMPKSKLYLTSFYFTVQTITTVGYGDMPITTFTE